MKKIVLTLLFFAISLIMSQAEAAYRHVVLFKFNDDAPKEKIDLIVTAFGELKDKIPTIIGYEWGTNVGRP